MYIKLYTVILKHDSNFKLYTRIVLCIMYLETRLELTVWNKNRGFHSQTQYNFHIITQFGLVIIRCSQVHCHKKGKLPSSWCSVHCELFRLHLFWEKGNVLRKHSLHLEKNSLRFLKLVYYWQWKMSHLWQPQITKIVRSHSSPLLTTIKLPRRITEHPFDRDR